MFTFCKKKSKYLSHDPISSLKSRESDNFFLSFKSWYTALSARQSSTWTLLSNYNYWWIAVRCFEMVVFNMRTITIHDFQRRLRLGYSSFVYICRVFPKLIPLWVAPLLLPYCKLIIVWPAFSCSSENSRTFLSASLGPIPGCPNLWA